MYEKEKYYDMTTKEGRKEGGWCVMEKGRGQDYDTKEGWYEKEEDDGMVVRDGRKKG